ncbi:MAG TPA: phosphoenolpyruvate carboxykinase (ATP) [Candidatus Avilachnospira avistercoris]|nr:phosphoenolpyruvate carboxykinase (ATP) [Candidatus Avilachnospira avistercoris]
MVTYGIEKLGITAPKAVYRNLCPADLTERAIISGEGKLTDTGALSVMTGKYTGRSPKDKFIVDSEGVHDKIAWGSVNMPIKREVFEAIKKEMVEYLNGRDVYLFDGFAGADPKCQRKFRIVNEMPSQNLFIHQLLIRPTKEELENFGEADFTIIVAPGYKCDPAKFGINSEAAIIIDYEAKQAIIAGSQYSGEIKKSVFSIMNYLMPVEENVLPMHCSANMDPETHETAVFFGLSGTGKTTLSADPNRKLIGDDEHGWSDHGIFNFEGGCYAKCIDLEEEKEPEIYHAIKFGSLVENVIIDEDRHPDYHDGSVTENTRVGYPIDYIDNAQIPGEGGIPKVVIFLTADAFGVLPPISKLSQDAAMYHFVTGFTSKLAGTERGITEPQPTFSTLFGEPFMPLDASVYANMLGERIEKYGTKVYLVNTGWTGGPYGVGSRMKLSYTRAMVTAALNGELEKAEYKHDEVFNVEIPQSCPGVPAEILNPKNTWADKAAYDAQAKKLAGMFAENFAKKYPNMPKNIAEAGPKA